MERDEMTRSPYRWVIVAAGGLLGCVAIGAMFSLPVFIQPITHDTGWTVAEVSTAMTIGFLAMAFAALAWGSLSDRVGARPVVMIGAIVLAAGLALASRATSLIEFQLLFGLAVGSGAAAALAPMMATVTRWFDTRRALAVSLVSAGMGMAPMTMSPLAAWLVAGYGWRTSMLCIAGLAAATMLPIALLVRRPPVVSAIHAAADPGASMTAGQVLSAPPYIILLLTNFFCCATHAGPIFHTVSYAVSCGIPLVTAVTIYSVEGLSGLGGRVAFGLLGDRFGARRTLVAGLLLQAFTALAYFFARDLAAFYGVALLFGFVYAGIMPLYAALARENFPPARMGMVIGGLSMAGGLGMATGPLAGGLIHDAFGGYAWLYLGAWGIGIGSFLIALTFRPMRHVQPMPLPA
jgi:MFS family permease